MRFPMYGCEPGTTGSGQASGEEGIYIHRPAPDGVAALEVGQRTPNAQQIDGGGADRQPLRYLQHSEQTFHPVRQFAAAREPTGLVGPGAAGSLKSAKLTDSSRSLE